MKLLKVTYGKIKLEPRSDLEFESVDVTVWKKLDLYIFQFDLLRKVEAIVDEVVLEVRFAQGGVSFVGHVGDLKLKVKFLEVAISAEGVIGLISGLEISEELRKVPRFLSAFDNLGDEKRIWDSRCGHAGFVAEFPPGKLEAR